MLIRTHRPRHVSAAPSFLIVLAALGCNQPPETTVAINPAEATTTDTLQAVVTATDANEDELTLTYTWSVDGTVQDDLNGDSVPAARTRRDEEWTVTVVASDGKEDGVPSTASTLIQNSAPTLTAVLDPERATSEQDLTVTSTVEDLDDDEITVSYAWTVDGAESSETGDTIAAETLLRGQTWSVTVIASDGTLESDPVTLTTVVDNAAPDILGITLTPSPPVADATIEAVTDVVDADGDEVTLAYQWQINGIQQTETSNALPVGSLERGDIFSVTVTPNDGFGDGTSVESELLTVANAIPLVESASLPPTVMEGETVSCEPTGWYDGDEDDEDYTYRWTVNGSDVANTTSTLDGTWFDKGDVVTCALTPNDGLDLGLEVTSNEMLVVNTPPSLDSAAIDPDPPQTEDTLSVTLGAWRDDDPADNGAVGFAYRWYVNGTEVSTEEELSGDSFTRGDTVYATVTPFDPDDEGTTLTTDEVTVVNTPPVIDALTFTPDVAFADEPLEVIASTYDADDDIIVLSYAWTLNGLPVADNDQPTLDASLFVRDDAIQVTVTANDGFESGTPATSDLITIANRPPSISAALLDPADIYEASLVSCIPQDPVDIDGDDITFEYVWTVNETEVGTDATLTGASFDNGDSVQCSIVASDGIDHSEPTASDIAVVNNTLPTIETVTISPAEPREGDILTAVVSGLADDDLDLIDALDLRYVWSVDDVDVSTEAELPSDLFSKGQEISVTVFASDSEAEGPATTSDPVIVRNSPPVISGVTLTPNVAVTNTSFEVQLQYSDADDDEVTFTYDWLVNGAPVVEGDTTGTLDPSTFTRDQIVSVQVTPADDEESGSPFVSPGVEIANSSPLEPEIAISPAWPLAGRDDLHCQILRPSSDADDDNVTYGFQWRVNGQPYSAGGDYIGPSSTEWPDDTVPAQDLAVGDVWECRVTPFDDQDAGPATAARAFPQVIDLREVSAGNDYSCGIRLDDTIACWGHNNTFQASPPDITAVKVATGFDTACAISTARELHCWGNSPFLTVPPTGTYIDVAVGNGHACAVGTDNAAVCWGTNVFGEGSAPSIPMVSVSVGIFHSCGITTADEAVCWGSGDFQQRDIPSGVDAWRSLEVQSFYTCGIGDDQAIRCWGTGPVDSPEGTFTALSAGPVHACAISTEQEILCWGDEGEVDLDPPEGLYAAISAGSYHTCATTIQGDTTCWGRDSLSQLGVPNEDYTVITAGRDHTCGIDEVGMVDCWGNDDRGQASAPDLTSPAVDVSLGDGYSCALGDDGSVICWGDDSLGQLQVPVDLTAVELDAGRNTACALDATGAIVCWGDDFDGLVSNAPEGLNWVTLSTGEHHACAVDDLGEMVCWGTNINDETVIPDLNADSEAEPRTFVMVSTGEDNTCALLSSQEALCWGNTTHGQHIAPDDTDFVDVISARKHSCGLHVDGRVSCWGSEAEGRLDIPTGAFEQISGTDDHICGVLDTGRNRCWGLYVY